MHKKLFNLYLGFLKGTWQLANLSRMMLLQSLKLIQNYFLLL